jgi:uncharacterized metal-binding protein
MDIKNMSTEELKNEYRSLYQMIYVVECYGISDIQQLQQIAIELEKRGIKIDTEPTFNKDN